MKNKTLTSHPCIPCVLLGRGNYDMVRRVLHQDGKGWFLAAGEDMTRSLLDYSLPTTYWSGSEKNASIFNSRLFSHALGESVV